MFLFYEYSFVLIIASFIYTVYYFCKKRFVNSLKEQSTFYYKSAVQHYKNDKYLFCLCDLYQSIGSYKNHQAFNFLGIVWGHLDNYYMSAECYFEAFLLTGLAFDSYKFFNANMIYSPELAVTYLQQESTAHLRNNNWEFAFLRSNHAIELIVNKKAPRFVEYGDCESWLRLNRLVAAAQLVFNSTDPIQKYIDSLEIDALWLKYNCRVLGYDHIIESLFDDNRQLCEKSKIIYSRWLDYDQPKRIKRAF